MKPSTLRLPSIACLPYLSPTPPTCPQSLANLSHALEPLRLSPDPPWLRDLLAATGAAMSITGPGQGLRGQGQGHGGQGQEQGQQRWGPAQRPGTLRPAPPELTQLAWALFSLRRRCVSSVCFFPGASNDE